MSNEHHHHHHHQYDSQYPDTAQNSDIYTQDVPRVPNDGSNPNQEWRSFPAPSPYAPPPQGPVPTSYQEVPSTLQPHNGSSHISAPVGTPNGPRHHSLPKKRLIVLCDGTWEDGLDSKTRNAYTNILRLSRTIESVDTRHETPISQIVFYQSGIGSEGGFYAEYIEGTTGSGLGDKVEEAYAFLASNYEPGDEIFLFGFSRGAYTARLVAMLVGGIGVLGRTDMDNFARIFLAYQKRGKTKDPKEIAKLDEQLEPWTNPNALGKRRAYSDAGHFSVKCVGVFDTVGSVGLPSELSLSHETKMMFGFPDRLLGEHVERAYQALALDETRVDFNCARFEQTPAGKAKGQILKQCWFTGCHADIGGGYASHDLADLTLTWMVSNVADILLIDPRYLQRIFTPVAKWGELPPHNPRVGFFKLASTQYRTLPTRADDPITHEYIHPSVLRRDPGTIWPALKQTLDGTPGLVGGLMGIEEDIKGGWKVDEGARKAELRDRRNSLDVVAKEVVEGGEDGVVAGQVGAGIEEIGQDHGHGPPVPPKTADHAGQGRPHAQPHSFTHALFEKVLEGAVEVLMESQQKK